MNKYQDGERVRLKENNEIVTVRNWFQYSNMGKANTLYQYSIEEYEGTWFSELELEKYLP